VEEGWIARGNSRLGLCGSRGIWGGAMVAGTGSDVAARGRKWLVADKDDDDDDADAADADADDADADADEEMCIECIERDN